MTKDMKNQTVDGSQSRSNRKIVGLDNGSQKLVDLGAGRLDTLPLTLVINGIKYTRE